MTSSQNLPPIQSKTRRIGFQGLCVRGLNTEETGWALELGMLPVLSGLSLQSLSYRQMVTEKVPGLSQCLVPQHVNSICHEITCGYRRGL